MEFYIIILALCGTTLACPDVKPIKDFDVVKYAKGTWYEIARYNNYDIEEGADCITYTFSPVTNVTIREIRDKKAKTINAALYPTEQPGKVVFHVDQSATTNITATVLGTDKKNYVVFYNCFVDKATNKETEFSWIITITPRITPELQSEIHKYIDKAPGLNASKFKWDHLTDAECMMYE